jgi:magnesium transporter
MRSAAQFRDPSVAARLYAAGATEADIVELSPDLVASLDDSQVLWVDVKTAEPPAELGELLGLGDAFADVSNEEAIRRHNHTVTLTVTGLAEDADDRPEGVPVHLAVIPNVVVTLHERPIRGLADPIKAIAGDPGFGRLGSGRFAGLLLEGMLSGYRAEVERIGQANDQLEERALRERRPSELIDDVVRIRHQVSLLRRNLSGQQPVFAVLVRPIEGDAERLVGQPDSELLEHLERVLQSVDQLREELLGSFDIIQGRMTQHTNDVVRVLTVVSSVLLPSVVIAGVMGMNFQLGWFDEPSNFYLVVGAMALLAVATIVLARLRGWI